MIWRILTERPVYQWLRRWTYRLSGRRYILVRTFNARHRPRLLFQGCQCTIRTRHESAHR